MSNKLKRKHKKHKQAKQPEDVRLGQPNRRLEKKRFEEQQKQKFNQIIMRRFR